LPNCDTFHNKEQSDRDEPEDKLMLGIKTKTFVPSGAKERPRWRRSLRLGVAVVAFAASTLVLPGGVLVGTSTASATHDQGCVNWNKSWDASVNVTTGWLYAGDDGVSFYTRQFNNYWEEQDTAQCPYGPGLFNIYSIQYRDRVCDGSGLACSTGPWYNDYYSPNLHGRCGNLPTWGYYCF